MIMSTTVLKDATVPLFGASLPQSFFEVLENDLPANNARDVCHRRKPRVTSHVMDIWLRRCAPPSVA